MFGLYSITEKADLWVKQTYLSLKEIELQMYFKLITHCHMF